jgi:hypothetical protein
MRTTLNKIRAHHPCRDGWEQLLRGLNKTAADDEPLWIDQVLDHNGLDDALRCLRVVENCDREIRLYAVWCARRVQHLIIDPRSIAALDVAERHARGEASDEELRAAKTALDFAAARAEANATEAKTMTMTDMTSEAAEMAARAKARSWASRAARAAAATNMAAAAAAAVTAAMTQAGAVAAWEARDAERAAQAEELRRICREMREDGR